MDLSEPVSQLQHGEDKVDDIQQNEECSINVKNVLEDMPACFITPTSEKIKRTVVVEDVNRLAFEFFQSV
jgi:hypothetical protein